MRFFLRGGNDLFYGRNLGRVTHALVALLTLFGLLAINVLTFNYCAASPWGCLMFTHPRANALVVTVTLLLPLIVQALLWVRLRTGPQNNAAGEPLRLRQQSAFWIALGFTPVSVVFLLLAVASVLDQQSQLWHDQQDFSFWGAGLTDMGTIPAPGPPLHVRQGSDLDSDYLYLQQEQPLGRWCPGLVWVRQVYFLHNREWTRNVSATVRDAHHLRCTLVPGDGGPNQTVDVTLP